MLLQKIEWFTPGRCRFLALISGILMALPFMYGQLALLTWVAPIPYLLVLLFSCEKNRTYKYFFSLSLCFGIGYFGLLYHWFVFLYPMDFAGLNVIESIGVILLAIIALSLISSLQYSLLPLGLRLLYHPFLKHHKYLIAFLVASLFTLSEWISSQTWLGIPWGRLAVSQTEFTINIQSTNIMGSYFVGFLIILFAAFVSIALLFQPSFRSLFCLKSYIWCAVAVFVLNFTYGVFSILLYTTPSENASKVLLVQGNVSSSEKWKESSYGSVFEKYVSVTIEGCEANKPDIVVWPETMLSYSMYTNEGARKILSDIAVTYQVDIFLGTFVKEDQNSYNAIVHLDPNGNEDSVIYVKRHLVPFGEYLPCRSILEKLFPFLNDINMLSTDLTPGESSSVWTTEKGKIGGLICFDSIYDTLALDSVQNDAELLVIVTNDSWYKDSFAIYQHNRHAVLRAVENRRWVVRAANTGVSSVISPTGEIMDSIAPLVTGSLSEVVFFEEERTLYSYVGNLLVWGTAGYCIAIGLVKFQIYKKEKLSLKKS